MKNKLILFALILGIPIVAYAVSEGIQSHLDSKLREAISAQYSDIDSESIQQLTVAKLCKDNEFAEEEICGTAANLNFMSYVALGAAAAGLILVSAIYVFGRIARTSRLLLLWLFRPGLYFTAALLVILILVYAGLAIASIYYGESVAIGRIHIKLIALIGIGAVIGAGILAQSAFSLIKKAQITVIGKSLSRDEAPGFWNVIEQLADRLGALRPQNIVLGLEPNFFVTEADTHCLNGHMTGRTLYCSLPLSRILNKDEFCSVIGHELGHFKGQDTKYSEKFYPIYRGTISSIEGLREAGGEGIGQLALLPAIAVMSYFFDCFSIAESRISRIRELAADSAGASLTTQDSLASALVKVHAFSGVWSSIDNAAQEALRSKKMFVNASKVFSKAVSDINGEEALSKVLGAQIPHPTDSHPPLGVRLESLKVTIEDISSVALNVNPDDPAFAVIEGAEKIEEEVSTAYQVILAKAYGINFDEVEETDSSNELSESPLCPNCQTPYDPKEYSQTAKDWNCSLCGHPLAK